jgi:hypothetical protein
MPEKTEKGLKTVKNKPDTYKPQTEKKPPAKKTKEKTTITGYINTKKTNLRYLTQTKTTECTQRPYTFVSDNNQGGTKDRIHTYTFQKEKQNLRNYPPPQL